MGRSFCNYGFVSCLGYYQYVNYTKWSGAWKHAAGSSRNIAQHASSKRLCSRYQGWYAVNWNAKVNCRSFVASFVSFVAVRDKRLGGHRCNVRHRLGHPLECAQSGRLRPPYQLVPTAAPSLPNRRVPRWSLLGMAQLSLRSSPQRSRTPG
jgi:hypothetical protein